MQRVMMVNGLCMQNLDYDENRLCIKKKGNVEGKYNVGCHLRRL